MPNALQPSNHADGSTVIRFQLFLCPILGFLMIRHPSHTHTPVNAVVGSETESAWGTGVRLEAGLESGIFASNLICNL